MAQDELDMPNDGWLARQRAALARALVGSEGLETGRVEQVADGIAHVSGLPSVRLDELLRFADGSLGFVMSLEEGHLAAVLLDRQTTLAAGMPVFGTGQVLQVPVGPALLGRVVDPLGRPLDDRAAPETAEWLPVERPAPAIIERALVSEPLDTGVLIVDALFAIGRGQRELIIGDRATGKTSLALDAIINQKHSDVICVYVAVGQRSAAVQQAIEAVRRQGAPERCVFVVATAADSAGLQWLAPFAGFSIAEYFRDRGQHALIVIDDLSKHAATHRELALLTHAPPGREAFPGDIFYLHARLLERAARLSPERGGGSLTALPIAQTEAGNLAAYIPTNLISITDGQIVLDSHLAAANQRPAVETGLSVSRVGGKAQPKALRQVAGRLRLEYSQFLELEMFTRFGGLGDARVRQQMTRGERIRALLVQPRFTALRRSDQIALLAALAEGTFDERPVSVIAPLQQRLPGWLDAHAPTLRETLEQGGELDDAARQRLVQTVAALCDELQQGGA